MSELEDDRVIETTQNETKGIKGKKTENKWICETSSRFARVIGVLG